MAPRISDQAKYELEMYSCNVRDDTGTSPRLAPHVRLVNARRFDWTDGDRECDWEAILVETPEVAEELRALDIPDAREFVLEYLIP